jgi:hypothetical protein
MNDVLGIGCAVRNPEQYISDSVGMFCAAPVTGDGAGPGFGSCADAVMTAHIKSRITRVPVFFIVPPNSCRIFKLAPGHKPHQNSSANLQGRNFKHTLPLGT